MATVATSGSGNVHVGERTHHIALRGDDRFQSTVTGLTPFLWQVGGPGLEREQGACDRSNSAGSDQNDGGP